MQMALSVLQEMKDQGRFLSWIVIVLFIGPDCCSGVMPNERTYNTIVNSFCKAGDIRRARSVIEALISLPV
jgi:pentatricopeptide repeat protein